MIWDANISRKIKDIGSRYAKERNFWEQTLSGNLVPVSFPLILQSADSGTTQKTGTVKFEITGEQFTQLMDLCKKSPHRLHLVLLTGLFIILEKYTGNNDIIIGTPVYKQETDEDFINTILALRIRFSGNATFKDLLLQLKDTVTAAVENQNYPLESLVEELKLSAADNEFPLFTTALLVENIHDKKYINHLHLPLIFSFTIQENRIEGEAEYNPSRYDEKTIDQIVSHYLIILHQVLKKKEIEIAGIDILNDEERKKLLIDFNDTETGDTYIKNKLLHQLVEEQAEQIPLHIAVIDSGSQDAKVAYQELNERSNRLAHTLISRGVKPGAIVGIMAERSIEMIIGLIGILKAGGAYLPISPGTPPMRRQLIIKESNIQFLVTDQVPGDEKTMEIPHPFFLDHPSSYSSNISNPEIANTPQNPGYIIYTSGSTGTPKGVILEHRGIVNYVTWAAKTYVKNETVTFPFYTSFAFDLTVTSIYTPLITGNTVIIYRGDEKEFLIKKVIEDNRVDIIKLTPSHLKLIRDMMMNETISFLQENVSRLKRLILGGENLETRLAADIYRLFAGKVEIYNEYGPTETVVGSMIYLFQPQEEEGESVSIGVPIANTRIYLLDNHQNPVPMGVPGEIHIGGAGVGRGYLNNPELTAEKFLATDQHGPTQKGRFHVEVTEATLNQNFLRKSRALRPVEPIESSYKTPPGDRKQKIYKTGDLARWLPDGTIEFLGRKDLQVKIRGFRVELGEIENKILNYNKPGTMESTESITKTIPVEEILQNLEPKQETYCNKCLLSNRYPGFQLDEQGVCQICRQYEEVKPHVDRYYKTEEDFTRLLQEIKKTHPNESGYDCLLMFSGGKDSSYVLYRLIDMGLKVLTFTFDNGYISEAAFRNIKRTTSNLKVDHVVGQSPQMNHVFLESMRSHHNVCQGCWHALNTKAVEIAHEKGIPLVISGLSRGQIFEMRLEGLFEAGIYQEEEIEEKLLLFRKAFHSKDNRFSKILAAGLPESTVEEIQFLDFFRYFNVPIPEIKKYLADKGWEQPVDTGFCSSNCIINDVGIYIHLKERGYHFYAAPLSWDVRLGQLSRQAGLQEISFQMNMEIVDGILQDIGYYRPITIKDTVVLDRKDDRGNHFLCAYIVSETGGTISPGEIRTYLAQQLPDYMVPSYFIQVEEIPLTASGKVDKKALMKMEGTVLGIETAYVEPRDDKEKRMADLCKEIFNLEKIGINDNFFSLGATSFNIIQLSNQLQTVFNKEIQVITLFEYPTIASFLDHIDLEMRDPEGTGETKREQEEEEWSEARQKSRDKFTRLRKKRRSGDEDV